MHAWNNLRGGPRGWGVGAHDGGSLKTFAPAESFGGRSHAKPRSCLVHMEYADTGPAPGWWALTGTPGTGKSTVTRCLPPHVVAIELRDLAAGFAGRAPGPRPVEVDLPKLGAWMRRHPPPVPVVVSGYLAHHLPVEGTIVLRC